MKKDVDKLISQCGYRLTSFGDKLAIYIEPSFSMEKKDWKSLRDNILKPSGFRHVGKGQRDWFKVL